MHCTFCQQVAPVSKMLYLGWSDGWKVIGSYFLLPRYFKRPLAPTDTHVEPKPAVFPIVLHLKQYQDKDVYMVLRRHLSRVHSNYRLVINLLLDTLSGMAPDNCVFLLRLWIVNWIRICLFCLSRRGVSNIVIINLFKTVIFFCVVYFVLYWMDLSN